MSQNYGHRSEMGLKTMGIKPIDETVALELEYAKRK